jgi:putative hemolysin
MGNKEPLLWQLLILLFLIFASAFFSMAEISFISLNKNKLEKKSLSGSRQAKRILSLTSNPSKFLATIQVGNTLTNFLASAFAAGHISGRFTLWLVSLGVKIPANVLATVSLVFITLVLSYISMVLSELFPKRIALKKADVLAFPVSGSILFFSRIFAPVVWLLTKSTNGLLRLIGIDPKTDAHAVTEEEIRLMIDVGSAKGAIRDGEKEMLNNVFEFDNKTAGEVMTHRRDTVLLKLEDSDEEWEKTILENRHNFFPVCGKNQDDIAGVLVFRDYLCLSDRRRETVMAQAVKPAQFVPITVRTHVLFARMKKSRNHFAVVVDEHGGLMGIVTIKDLLEELVGSLDDDSTALPEQPLIVKTGPGEWTLSGAVSLDKAARELEVTLPVERYDTFAGFVFSLLGQIPEDGSQAVLEAHGLKIEILEIREHRLEKALVTKL